MVLLGSDPLTRATPLHVVKYGLISQSLGPELANETVSKPTTRRLALGNSLSRYCGNRAGSTSLSIAAEKCVTFTPVEDHLLIVATAIASQRYRSVITSRPASRTRERS